MLSYLGKRILQFIPTLVLISLMAFIISINAPGDPVERLLRASDSEGGTSEQTATSKQAREELRSKLGLDLPVFYVGFQSLAHSDTLYKIQEKPRRKALSKLVSQTGNWDGIQSYYRKLQQAELSHTDLDIDKILKNYTKTEVIEVVNDSTGEVSMDTVTRSEYNKNQLTDIKNRSNVAIINLMQTHEPEVIAAKFDTLSALYARHAFLQPVKGPFESVRQGYQDIMSNKSKWKTMVPWLAWYGLRNQYHVWLFGNVPFINKEKRSKVSVDKERHGILRGDFGISYIDGQPIKTKIWKSFKWSFVLAVLGIALAYIISIPIGIYAAYKKDQLFDRTTSVILFILYSMPSFFVGTLLLYAFSNPDVLVWLPEGGIEDPSTYEKSWGFFAKLKHRLPYLILPVVTYTYGSLAFLSRIMRVGIIEIFNQDFIRTARAKGLSETVVVMKHALRNSLLPIITVFANVFPLAIGGAVIIEVIFSYPGMGVEIYNAVLNQDYPVIVAVFTLLGFLTMVGYLVSDLLYGVVDPRISFK